MTTKDRLDLAVRDMSECIDHHQNHACPVFAQSCELLSAIRQLMAEKKEHK